MPQTLETLRMDLLDQLQVDERGMLTFNGIPSLLMPAAFLREIKATGEKFMGRGLHGIIYHVGEQFARRITEQSRAREPAEPEAVFRRIARAVQLRGWGRVEVLRIDFTEPSCRVRLPDCPHDDLDTKHKHPWCPLVVGFVAGMLGCLSDRTVIAQQIACRSMGAPACEVSAVALPPS